MTALKNTPDGEVYFSGHEVAEIPSDFLSAETLRSRRNLVVICSVIIAVHSLSLQTSAISIVGVNFSTVQPQYFMWAMLIVACYEAVCYVLRAFSDYAKWQNSTLKRSTGIPTMDVSNADRYFTMEELIERCGTAPNVFDPGYDMRQSISYHTGGSGIDSKYVMTAVQLCYAYRQRRIKFQKLQKFEFWSIEILLPALLLLLSIVIVCFAPTWLCFPSTSYAGNTSPLVMRAM